MTQLREGGAWWLALPGAAPSPLPECPVIARDDVGHPWLLGNSAPAATASAHGVDAAAFGDFLGEETAFADSLRRAVVNGGYDRLMDFPGSYQLAVREPSRLHCYGDAAGLRRVYTATYAGAAVAGNRARTLAALSGAGLDHMWVASRMCAPAVPTAVQDVRSPYRGVVPVPAGFRAVLTAAELPRIGRYWYPPRATLTLHEGATQLRRALETAVVARARRSSAPVTIEFSGGLDSAALAAVAAAELGTERVRLVTIPSAASGDLPWARLVADHLGAHHDVLDRAPEMFARLPDAVSSEADEPPIAAGAARIAHTSRALASMDGGLHLNGQGGDEVLTAPLSHLGPLLRAPGRGTIRRLRGYAALHATSTANLVRRALAPCTYTQWLRTATTSLGTEVDPIRDAVSWEAHPRIMPWASPRGRHLVTEALDQSSPAPWGDRDLHAALARIRASAAAASAYGQSMEELGGPVTAFPFFDRPVMDACLAVRSDLRSDPWILKPLLVAAMRDALPTGLLGRITKGSYTPDIHRGWAHHQADVLAILHDPLLADLELIDAEKLQRDMIGWGATELPPAYVTDLLALELWARSTRTQAFR